MCLGIPGKVTDTYRANDMPMGTVDFDGVAKRVCLAYTPEVAIGDYVVVHVGFALQRIDETQAREVFALLRQLGELGELDAVGDGVAKDDPPDSQPPPRGGGRAAFPPKRRGADAPSDDVASGPERPAGGAP
jgi:hydrogenase expression/formation protein HypC